MTTVTTPFTELVGCRLPLQLAGMGGGTSDVGLAAAVTEAGGLGVLGAGGLPGPVVEPMLDALSGATQGPFGVNFLMPFLDRDAVVAASKRCRVVEFFYASPERELVELVHEGGALAGWQVGSADEARAAVQAGCDFVAVQGTEAGGHVRGKQTLREVLAEAAAAVSVPIVAAGGIGTPGDVAGALAEGASAVRIGTCFLAAQESVAHPVYIDALIGASAEDTVVTEAFSVEWPNAPHRVLRSCIAAAEATDEDVVGSLSLGAMEIPVPRFSVTVPTKDVKGNVAAMCMYAGTSVGAVREQRLAAAIVAELCSEL